MGEQENVKVVEEVYAAFEQGDVPALLKTLANDVDWLAYGPSDVAIYGQRRGHQQMTELFALITEDLDVEAFELREFIAQGDKVAVPFYERGKVKATGGTYEINGVDVFTLRDGKVASLRGYWDSASLAAAYRGS